MTGNIEISNIESSQHILIVHHYYWPDKVPCAAIMRSVAAHFVKEGHSVDVLTSQPSYREISAKRRKIPIFHMEAGNPSFDQCVPEEINRRLVDHIADINLTYYSIIARDYLLREGLPPDRVIKIGSPMYEVLHHYMPQVLGSDVFSRLDLTAELYFLVSAHREENSESERSFAKPMSARKGPGWKKLR